jgi:outer membrane murein-binding lipoprotein Lpp
MALAHVVRTVIAVTITAFLLAGCASTGQISELETTHYTERLQTRTDGGMQVSTSVLSDAEAAAVYGVPLADKGIQPVWIEVENNDDIAYWLLSPGIDPNFFPASEAADVFAGTSASTNRVLTQRFSQLAFQNPIPPGATVSGFVLTNRDEGVKMVELDLVASGHLKTFSTFSLVPGFRADFHDRDIRNREFYTADEITNFTDDAAFRAALEALPCCVTNKKGTRDGDPLNLVVVGTSNEAFPALVRRGWHPTEATYAGSVRKMINSVLSGERYRYSPVSPLFLYGRPQDIALQKARDSIHQRNHLRLWKSPMQYHGKPVWVGQISRDIGTRLTIHSPYLTTHKIDPDVDEALLALIEDLAYSQNLSKMGLVNGVGAASREEPRENLTTDPYFTNGFRGVLIFDTTPTSLADIEFLPWEGREGGMVRESIKRNQQ